MISPPPTARKVRRTSQMMLLRSEMSVSGLVKK